MSAVPADAPAIPAPEPVAAEVITMSGCSW